MASCFDVEITDLFNFITVSFSEMKGKLGALILILIIIECLLKDLITDVIGPRFLLGIRKDLGFWYVQSGYYIREKLIKCLTELLIVVYGFIIINEVTFFTF